MKLCAGRIGQVINFTDLGRDCGLSYQTMKAWLSLLESSYIAFLLQPYYDNFSKRLIKSPKLFFYDTGIACSLLGIETIEQLDTHYLKGNLFESLMIAEFFKERFNQGQLPNAYFWRDKTGHEIDCILEKASIRIPIEIKSSRTISSDFFYDLKYWNKLTQSDPQKNILVYGGDTSQARQHGRVIGWSSVDEVVSSN